MAYTVRGHFLYRDGVAVASFPDATEGELLAGELSRRSMPACGRSWCVDQGPHVHFDPTDHITGAPEDSNVGMCTLCGERLTGSPREYSFGHRVGEAHPVPAVRSCAAGESVAA